MQIKINSRLIDLSTPVIMGIVNMTPDSFYQGSRFGTNKKLLKQVEKMLVDGASIIDIGGYSTRPMAEHISSEEEIKRISSALELILKHFTDVPISVDTFRSEVVLHTVHNFGIGLINDISGGTLDNKMFETIAELKLAYVLMHTRGNPQIMMSNTTYENVIAEVLEFLQHRVARLHLLGVNDIIADPGFGFAKTIEQNFSLLKHFSYFKALNVPLLAGLSRKSMIYKGLAIKPEYALNGTTALHMVALQNGASILRVHDVSEAMEAIKLYTLLNNAN